ncbi:hypothetical protein C4J93_2934 [Pseudomonas sp. R2-37-08W]|nr:hypothetical protein C4J93_2934 [Pseudomonas sp. R2-37-08W]
MVFRITGPSPEPFQSLFGLTYQELASLGMKRSIVDSNPGFSGHASAAPSRFTDARLSDLLKNTAHRFKGQKWFTTPIWLIKQTVQPLSLEALTPARDNG